MYVCVSGSKKCLFSENLTCFVFLLPIFEIGLFALLLTICLLCYILEKFTEHMNINTLFIPEKKIVKEDFSLL